MTILSFSLSILSLFSFFISSPDRCVTCDPKMLAVPQRSERVLIARITTVLKRFLILGWSWLLNCTACSRSRSEMRKSAGTCTDSALAKAFYWKFCMQRESGPSIVDQSWTSPIRYHGSYWAPRLINMNCFRVPTKEIMNLLTGLSERHCILHIQNNYYVSTIENTWSIDQL